MINLTLIWLLAVPLLIGVVIWISRKDCRDSWQVAGIYAAIGLVLTLGGFYIAKGAKTMDHEIWSGQVVEKTRKHDTYEESYECNCRTVTTGSGKNQSSTRVCDTCYRTHWTVLWSCNSTVGSFDIKKVDETSKSVWNSPNPSRWEVIKKGDPVAARKAYVNYVQAVPNSLFDPSSADVKSRFGNMLPEYPDNVYDFYRLNRFVGVGWNPVDSQAWNDEIALGLRTLGPAKQVNLIVVVAKTADPTYEFALRDHWEGVNKNDVVLLIGSSAWPKIDFVRVISWTKNETFKVELRDRILEMGTVTRAVIPATFEQIGKNFERRHMSEFEYLDGEIDPPDWMIYMILAILVLGGGFAWWKIPQWCSRGTVF